MSFTVTYNGNGNTAGTVPVDSNTYPVGGKGATVLTPASNFVSGADTWARWNTEPDGTGDKYGPYATGTVNPSVAGNVTLYAMWWTVDGLTNGGITTHYQLKYERCLAGTAFNLEPARTNLLLTHIEADHSQLSTWFGGIDVNGFFQLPMSTYVGNLGGGANVGYSGTLPVPVTIMFKPGGGDYNMLRYLMYSEVSEMFMNVQNAGWYGGGNEQSCGEALSRFCAYQFLANNNIPYLPTYAGYATAYTWLNSSLPTSNSSSTQLFRNGPNASFGHLVSAIDASVTSLTTDTGFSGAYDASFLIQIENEQMLVTAQSSTYEIFTVTRGYNGTSAAPHAAGVNVSFNYGSRADYVNTTLEYDHDIDSGVGCGALFINYLFTQLGFSIEEIIQSAPGAANGNECLRGVYNNLTGDPSDPFPFFKMLLDNAYPPDQVSSIPGPNPDDPWPLGSLTFWGVKSTWGSDEVSDIIKKGGVYKNAFWLMLEGFNQQVVGSIVPALPTIGFSGATASADSDGTIYETTNTKVPQHIRFPYDMNFSQNPAPVFPQTGETTAAVQSEITILGVPFPALDDFFFIAGADPYFTNVIPTSNPANENAPYLSGDLRVFTATPALNTSPVSGTGAPPFSDDSTDGAYTYISALLPWLNANFGDPSQIDPFDANSNVIPDQQLALNGDSSVTPYTAIGSSKLTNYNFAIARVRLQGTEGTAGEAQNVKVFFRVWGTQTADTDWNPNETYLHAFDSNGNIIGPAAPADNHTIPFFATNNLVLTDLNNAEFGPSGVNNKTIEILQGDSQWTYFGCFLDVYNTSLLVNGVAINKTHPGTHHCLVAEINYAGAPIQSPGNGVVVSPENSSQLAQRNLQITPSDNPGGPPAHRIPQTFDMQLSAIEAIAPDELMIDWGVTPVGSIASIFWPQLQANDVIQLANFLYGYHALSASDANTLQCLTTNGATYIPIPVGEAASIAGLFTVDLPTTVRRGQEFNIVVRRLRARNLAPPVRNPPPQKRQTKSKQGGNFLDRGTLARNASSPTYISKAVVGSFNVRIPVQIPSSLLRPEADTLAIMKARLAATAPTSRWYHVLVRYIGYLSGRVDGVGGPGTASSIPPSFGGALVPLPYPGEGNGKKCCYTGKVSGICYDGSGKFEGFLMEVESCERGRESHDCGEKKDDCEKEQLEGVCCGGAIPHEHRFDATEEKIYRLIEKAWCHGLKICVCAPADTPYVVTEIVFRQPMKMEHDC